ncbi:MULTISPECIES: ABC-F family ATP-binding cassette domain-containing protein [Roseivirga]|jgi:ATP-binding cassette subfamily F protein 3|uniref:ABC transporter ATP-binding protein n=1 Tax=Roseivirga thermotolerans TaxID=1758176 RepID=A0ABQ3IDH3_9BACT|nr:MULTISPECIES: ABC-F family ATP-binding cassette domain-containing protein [Roseivirga]GHE72088.1 ABC transporter ATP-binding protein [Roseivirga thermotolerans]|tara:strand:- start:23922 stop:25841 length:1920 start_codon:yes stop_codon:yes gene_type:complete
MIAINNLSYYIGDRPLYDSANLHIKPNDRIGLIGLNGKGKSTLLRLIIGDYQPTAGEITKSKECTIGFLNQDLLSYQSDDSILSIAMEAFEEANKLQRRIDQLLHQMEVNYEDQLVEKLAKAQEQFEALGGYSMQSEAEAILEGIGFKTEDLKRPLREFSGGWRMRVMLAKLLLQKPSLLMLDEPTNHLDLPSIQWIENYLRTYEGAIIVVSHDRYFLDNVVTSIVEVSGFKLTQYSGNYSFYLEEKAQREEIQKNAYENQQAQIRQTERFIERFRAKSSKARQVQSRVKALERMDLIEDVVDENITMNFQFGFKQKSGRFIVELNNISKSYGDLQILKNTTAQVERGDKIALIGANGKGKSTLLRIIAGTEKIEGQRQEGYNVNTAFYAQHQLESLNIENEIIQELQQAGSNKSERELRGILGCFLFQNEEVFKKIKVLSGGEKSRVALAKTLLSEANFLMMDEPTNHLDFLSVNILIQALQQYEGTFVIVSHDRHFISQIANKIWYIEDEQIKVYPGTYEEYEYWMSQRVKAESTPTTQSSAKTEKPKTSNKKVRNNEDEQQLKKLKQNLADKEAQIEQLEQQVEAIEGEMALPEVFENQEVLAEKTDKHQALKTSLQKVQQEWESLYLEIEAQEAD